MVFWFLWDHVTHRCPEDQIWSECQRKAVFPCKDGPPKSRKRVGPVVRSKCRSYGRHSYSVHPHLPDGTQLNKPRTVTNNTERTSQEANGKNDGCSPTHNCYASLLTPACADVASTTTIAEVFSELLLFSHSLCSFNIITCLVKARGKVQALST